MNLTKQDLQKIVSRLAAYGIKDSQFKKVTSLNSDSLIAIVQDGSNATVTADQLLSYIKRSYSLDDLRIVIDGLESTTLAGVLSELYGYIKKKKDDNLTNFDAHNIPLEQPIPRPDGQGTPYITVQDIIYYILSVLKGYSYFPCAAAETEINNLFNS